MIPKVTGQKRRMNFLGTRFPARVSKKTKTNKPKKNQAHTCKNTRVLRTLPGGGGEPRLTNTSGISNGEHRKEKSRRSIRMMKGGLWRLEHEKTTLENGQLLKVEPFVGFKENCQ